MAPPGQQQQGGGGGSGDNSLAVVWIMALLFITGYVIWYLGHKYIVSFVLYLDILQAKFIGLFISSEALSKELYLMETVNREAVNWDQLLYFTRFIGGYTCYPVIVVLTILALILYFSNITLKFRKARP